MVPSPIVIREASPSNRWKQMQRPTAKHSAELGESCGREGGKNVGARGVKDTIRKPTESTNLGSQVLTEVDSITKEPTWD